MRELLEKILAGQDLSRIEMASAMRAIMTGQATPAQIGGFLLAMRMKGESVEEITAAAQVMRELATPVTVQDNAHLGTPLVDIVGTGGDGVSTFNISTAAMFVAASAGAQVAKHGNRSVSSKSGSADVLEAAGARLDLNPRQIGQCIEQVGIGFMFAPQHHSAMKHAIGPRRELGVRTLFNLLGPLTNPASAQRQVLGVFSKNWVEPLAHVLQNLGSTHALVVHAEDGMDEISITAPTLVAELRHGLIQTYTLMPELFGLNRATLTALQVADAAQSLAMVQAALANQPGPARDIVMLNAGAAIYVAGLADTLHQGVAKADAAIASGAAHAKLVEFVAWTQQPPIGGETA